MSLQPDIARALRLQYQQLLLWGIQIQQGRIPASLRPLVTWLRS